METPAPALRPLAAVGAVLALAGCGGDDPRPAATPAPADWRAGVREADRGRLRDWRTAWIAALAKARGAGAGGQIAGEGVLLQPDAALDAAPPPDGPYRCRTIKLGAKSASGPNYIAYPAFACRVGDGLLVKLGGSQRPAGRLYPGEGGRLVFLGAMALGDERGVVSYGRDPDRNMVGFVERIGPRRWRLILPYPNWESLFDVMELVPAG